MEAGGGGFAKKKGAIVREPPNSPGVTCIPVNEVNRTPLLMLQNIWFHSVCANICKRVQITCKLEIWRFPGWTHDPAPAFDSEQASDFSNIYGAACTPLHSLSVRLAVHISSGITQNNEDNDSSSKDCGAENAPGPRYRNISLTSPLPIRCT
jgi:hypothetical protein